MVYLGRWGMDGVRGIVKLRLAGRGWVRVNGCFLAGTGFLTGNALGTGKTLLSDFFRVKVSPFSSSRFLFLH